jgi:flagellar motor switch/type III secretory pathway protein FliN
LQVILVVNQIYWCQEVEEAFRDLQTDKYAMANYNKMQVQQLTDLIQVTRTELKKADRQKVMNMITIDAHSRDMIEQVPVQLLFVLHSLNGSLIQLCESRYSTCPQPGCDIP